MNRLWRRRWALAGAALAALALGALVVPEPDPPPPAPASRAPFEWHQDEVWTALERRFVAQRTAGCSDARPSIDAELGSLGELAQELAEGRVAPGDPRWAKLEQRLFELGSRIAACRHGVTPLIKLLSRLRRTVKDQSRAWDLTSPQPRARIYRLLYGSRVLLEEVLTQVGPDRAQTLVIAEPEPSATPLLRLLGVELHSGDLLVSRGGAPTSALIARGNDYPGNFSHVALLHVSPEGEAHIIEAHIERGVVISTVDEYLEDTKLRILVLRLRADLPALRQDPQLPHRAATFALEDARRRHIPYDFAMDRSDPEKQFCSEVASAAYRHFGVHLWDGLSSISSPGTARWLAAFGVRYFETEGPSDLEYDPHLTVVAEWRDPETLSQDRLDNAILDALLEGAASGDTLEASWIRRPLARLAKAYSTVAVLFGGVGPVPEGMSADSALRLVTLRARHAALKSAVQRRIEAFRDERGYPPPYWEEVRFAREETRSGAGK